MSRRAQITPEIMTKAWKLHGMGVDNNTIGETLGISEHSACRIVKIMTTAQNGGDVDAVGNGHQAQKEFAKKMFGIEDKREEAPQEKPSEVEDESAILYKANAAIEKQNKLLERQNELLETQNTLLERLCTAWCV